MNRKDLVETIAQQAGLSAAQADAALTAFVAGVTDAVASGGGRLLGRRRLAPTISPGKTIAGFVSGLVGGLLPMVLYSQLPGWSFVELAGLFFLVAASSQLGDLVESAIKRDLGVKDAPALIPGHGGLLDRFDSYFFAFPVAFIYTVFLKS